MGKGSEGSRCFINRSCSRFMFRNRLFQVTVLDLTRFRELLESYSIPLYDSETWKWSWNAQELLLELGSCNG